MFLHMAMTDRMELKMRIHRMLFIQAALFALGLLAGCAGKPLNPWTADSPPLALVPVADADINDQRGRFREIFCEVLESRGEAWPGQLEQVQAAARAIDDDSRMNSPQTTLRLELLDFDRVRATATGVLRR